MSRTNPSHSSQAGRHDRVAVRMGARARVAGVAAAALAAGVLVPLSIAGQGEAVMSTAPARPTFIAGKAQVAPARTLTSARLGTVKKGGLLVLFIGSDGPGDAAQSTSVKGCGLRWKVMARANGTPGSSEIWKARANRTITGCRAVATRAHGTFQGQAILTAFRGVAVARALATSGSGAASLQVRARRGSVIWGVGNDWDGAVRRVVQPGQVKVKELLTSRGDTIWVQRTRVRKATKVMTFGTTAPSNHRFNLAAIVLVPNRKGGSSTAPAVATQPDAPAPTTQAPAPTTPAPAPTTPVPTVPVASGWPNSSNTGVPAGTSLTASGAITVTTPGTVIDARDIRGGVVIKAANVTIKRSRITGTGDYGVQVVSGNVVIEDTEISGFANGIAFDNWAAYRVNIHGVTDDGVKLGSNVTLQDSYLHHFATGPGAHADGAQLQSGEVNVVVRHNYIDPTSATGTGANAALFIAPDLGPSTNGPLTIEGNLLGGGNYTLFCLDGNYGQYFVRAITIRNNRFIDNAEYGAVRVNVPVSASGNVWDATGRPVSM